MRFVPKRLEKTADISRGDTSWQSFLKNVASVLIACIVGYLLLGALGELLARTIPDRWEARLFSSLESVSASGDLERAEKIFQRMLEVPGLRPLPYRLFLVPTSEPNAFAVAGGAVGLTQGLLDDVESDAGLALVLGHELGHHQGRHPLRRIGRVLVFSVARAMLFGGQDTPLVDQSLALAESSYSRRQESEADAFGLRLVHEIYGQTEGSLEFFELIRAAQGNEELRWAAFVRSHPLTADRIAELRTLQLALNEGL
jgi:predicted Zn-dependent protease